MSPPIDVLPSLARLMNAGIGEGKTRRDHRQVADQLYAFYAEGRDLRRLVTIIGEASLGPDDQRLLAFADGFDRKFLHPGTAGRSIDETLDLAWSILDPFTDVELKRIDPEIAASHRPAPA